MAMTEFGMQIANLTKEFLRRELERDTFLKQERELVRATILELSHVPTFRSYVCFLLHCRKQAQYNSIARDVLKELYRYLTLNEGQEKHGDKDERFEAYLRKRYQLFASQEALPWSCGIRVRNGADKNWYAPVLLQGIPVTTASDFAGRVFITPPRLLRHVRIEIWRGDASVETTTDRRLNFCDQFSVPLCEEVPADTFVWIKMELDESGCGNHCEVFNKIYAPMKIRLFEARRGVLLGEKHWHLSFGATTKRASGSPGQVAPWAGLEALMHQALSWLEKWEGIEEEEEAVVTWLYRAEQVMRKQDELWLRHVLDVLLVELRRQPGLRTLLISQTLSNIEDDNLRAEVQADSSYEEVLQVIFSDYEDRRDQRPADDADPVRRSDLVISLLRAVMADEEIADEAAENFADIVKAMLSGGSGGGRGMVQAISVTSQRDELLRDTFQRLVNIESGVEKHIVRRDWVEGKSHEIRSFLSKQNDVPAASELRPGHHHREPDGDILSLVPGERDWREPVARG